MSNDAVLQETTNEIIAAGIKDKIYVDCMLSFFLLESPKSFQSSTQDIFNHQVLFYIIQ